VADHTHLSWRAQRLGVYRVLAWTRLCRRCGDRRKPQPPV